MNVRLTGTMDFVIECRCMVSIGPMVLVGTVCAPHGIVGHVKIKTFTHKPESISSYGELSDGSRIFHISIVSVLNNSIVIAKIRGISTRTEAEALRNVHLYVHADRLPKLQEDEFYKSDLIGMSVRLVTGEHFGTVTEVFNFGSGDIIEISPTTGKKIMFSFSPDIFTNVNMSKRELTIIPPEFLGGGQ